MLKPINGEIQLKNLLTADKVLNKYTKSQKMISEPVNNIILGISSITSHFFSKNKPASINYELKQAIQEPHNVKSTVINDAEKSRKIYTQEELKQELVNGGFISNDLGEYKITASDEYKQKVFQQYGENVGVQIVQNMEKPITNLKELLNFVNVENGKYSQYWQENIQELSTYYNILKRGPLLDNIDKFSSGHWESIMNTVKIKASKDVVEALDYYKGGSYEINSALSELKQNPDSDIDNKILKYIDSIYTYLESQQIPESMHVYREEGFGVFNSVELSDGRTLKQALENIDTKNQNDVNSLIEDVLNHNYVATQERFMSTSLVNLDDPIYGNKHAKIKWDIEVPAGTKGIFIEGAIIGKSSALCDELEYLVQKNSKILINGIRYDNTLEQWFMTGKIINNQ